MVEPTDLREVSPTDIEDALPDRQVTSLRDIEALYGELYTLATAGGGEYAKYLTPDAAEDLLGKPSVLAVRVDLRGETPTLDADRPVVCWQYTEDLIPRLSHSKYASARGVDHSLTHKSGRDNEREKLAAHARDRLTRWPTEDAVREVAEDHDDGWLVDALATLGESESVRDAISGSDRIPDERTMLVTVAFRLDADERNVARTAAYDGSEKWHLPGEFEVFQEAMAARKTRKFKAKNEADDAVGLGTCFVNDTDEAVYGVVDDPLKSYLSKQAEKFPRFDSDESWRTQPMGRDAAIAAQNAETFLDACQYSGARGASVYYLPYLRKTPDADDAKRLFTVLAKLTNVDGDRSRTPVERTYESADGVPDHLRYAVLVVHKYQKDRWRLVAGSTNVSDVETSKLGAAHRAVLEGPSFGDGGAFQTNDEWALTNPDRPESAFTGMVSKPGYFFRTCAETDDDEPSADDLRFRATVAAISGGTIRIESLLESYVERLAEEFDTSDGWFPRDLVASQYAQFAALAERGVVEASGETTRILEQAPDMTPEMSGTEPSRIEKLDEFIDRHPALEIRDDYENYERRGAFVLGALVGRVTQYQRYEDKSMTAVKRHPIDNLTKHNVARTATDVVGLNVTYGSEDGGSSRIRDELAGRVCDDLQHADPEDWDITTQDLRFHYAMGIAYGLNDTSDYEEEDNDD
ncbi:hypothetical protein NGM10_01220 [Halorussus salilacus]|uniref:TM1802 family CRISPR-associated protein n=1 Tax=Halorussus salilacus TaxID=2953750 RepID=UPI0020A194A5|nr:TM1802 family CRISPR-associated protein [Halorussus salilacus]USZ68375.1 hypothetical protein NGM10_01220 [Halorussus salilacus]